MKKQISLIIFALTVFCATNVAAFTDVGEDSQWYQAVSCLGTKKIVNGYPDGSFMPDRPVTVGELTALVSRAAGTEYDDSVFSQAAPVSLDEMKRFIFSAGAAEIGASPLEKAATRGEAAQMIYDVYAKAGVDNISHILNSISREPHPIGSVAIENVKNFLTDALKSYGYEVTGQDFGYIKESIPDKAMLFTDEYVFAPGSQAQDGVATNVIGIKKAAIETDKTVIVSAHYDTTSKVIGAIDNSSGVSAVAELARQLADLPLNYNLEIVFFSAEELNLGGSKYFAQNLTQEEKQNILFNINIDCVGENNRYFPEVRTNNGLGEISEYALEERPDIVEQYELSKTLVNSFAPVLEKSGMAINPEMMPASDHVSLEQIGIPAIVMYQRNDRRKVWEDEEAEKLENIDVNKISYIVDVTKAMLMYKNQ